MILDYPVVYFSLEKTISPNFSIPLLPVVLCVSLGPLELSHTQFSIFVVAIAVILVQLMLKIYGCMDVGGHLTENSDSGFKLWLCLNWTSYPNFPMYLLSSQLKNQLKKKAEKFICSEMSMSGRASLVPVSSLVCSLWQYWDFRSSYSWVLLRINAIH